MSVVTTRGESDGADAGERDVPSATFIRLVSRDLDTPILTWAHTVTGHFEPLSMLSTESVPDAFSGSEQINSAAGCYSHSLMLPHGLTFSPKSPSLR